MTDIDLAGGVTGAVDERPAALCGIFNADNFDD